MPQVILGIDAGTYSIKIAKAERTLGEFYLTDFYELPLTGHDVLTPEQSTTALLAKFFEEHPLHYDTAVASLSGLKTAFRILEFPFTQVKKIDSALEFELENHIPFPIEDLLIDYVILDKTDQSSRALAVYTPKSEMIKLLGQLSHAGYDPRYVSVECLDLANLYHSGLLPPEGTYAILDIGHSKTNLCIMQGPHLKAVRTIAIGGKSITQAIAKKFDLTWDEAEKKKIKEGQVSPFDTQDPICEAIQPVIDDLLVQVRQTLFAFYEKGDRKMLEAVYLCGGSSRLSGIDQYISNRLRLNVSPLDILDYHYNKLADPELARPVIPPVMAQLFKALYPSKTLNINFRRGEFAYKRDIQAISGNLRQVAALAVAVFILGIFYFAISLFILNGQEKQTDKSISALLARGMESPPKKLPSGGQAALSFINSKINESNDRLKKLEGDNTPSALELLKLISINLPGRNDLKLDIDDLNISSDRVRMEGRTVSYEAIDKIKNSLEKVPAFKNVQTGNVRKGIQDEIKFSLSFDVGAT